MKANISAVRHAVLLFGLLTSSVAAAPPLEVTVSEGTSMSVAVSPDGRTLAIDLQGSIWTLPASGGPAKRITDVFNDARQPVFSPDGQWIVFFAYRDGGYNLWAIAPDGSNQHKLTVGPYDDREPAFSHDGKRIAFASDRDNPLGSSYNIWVLDIASGTVHRLTNNPAENHMPSWSPNDEEIAFSSTREGGASVWAVRLADNAERKVSTAAGVVEAPSWSPGGEIVYHAAGIGESRLEVNGKSLTGAENAFSFRASFASASDFYYVSDGKIRKRSLTGGAPQTIEFKATLAVTRAQYTRRKRDFDSTVPRPALGIVRPVIAPDGKKIAFAAVGDIYVMPIGGKPENITHDKYLDTDPAWSPDGNELVYSSDKAGNLLQLWIHDFQTGQDRQLTKLTSQPMGATWSPDGKQIAFFDVDGMWRAASLSVVDVATGNVTKIHNTLFGPGTPTWSPDGKRVALAMVSPYSKSFREGTNQVLTVSATGGDDKWYAPVPNLSIDSRGGCGPVWSPDGKKMAAIYEGQLAVWPVSRAGEPLGPIRHMTTEIAHSPSWSGDSTHILYQSMDKLKVLNVESGEVHEVPVSLKYTPGIPKGRIVVHAGSLVDGKSATARSNVDIVIVGNRIVSVGPHKASLHAGAALVDASKLTAMPGLIEYHSHLQKDLGEAENRAWLAFGITTVRSPGNTPYEGVEDREANDAGVRIGPRIFTAGYLMEWRRVYYKMGIAISSPAQLEMELERSKVLQHDMIKSYVRLPDLQQARVVEFAHSIGVPVGTHEIYPAALLGVDSTEHTGATSRRGYSPKQATLGASYDDVIQLFGKSQRYLCPTLFGGGGREKLFADEPSLRDDPRIKLYPPWLQAQIQGRNSAETAVLLRAIAAPAVVANTYKMVMDVMKAGGKIVAGTDTPSAFNLHAELESYILAGMTPYQALKTATVNSAEALALDAGSIEPGKLADLVIVEGNPLENIENAHKVKRVIANGRLYELEDLLNGTARNQTR
jgi:Tol biopolymer transport system component/imidazolonepropionase-like amidohydrolase